MAARQEARAVVAREEEAQAEAQEEAREEEGREEGGQQPLQAPPWSSRSGGRLLAGLQHP